MKLQLQNEIKKFKLIIAVVKWWIYCQPLGGRGKTVKISNRKHFLNGIIFTISAACVLVMLIGGVIMGGYCSQQIWHWPSSLSQLLCSFRSGTHSICGGVYQLCTYNDNLHQKCNYGIYIWTSYSKYPKNS